jgi:NADH-quinone oxidoreductase subunit M
LVLVAPRTLPDISRLLGLVSSFLVLWIWISLTGSFDFGEISYQFLFCFDFMLPSAISEFSGGIDGFALCLILLTAIIMPICIYASVNVTKNINEFITCILLIELFLIISFVTTNMLVFFIFFESVLIPMFIMIGY